ncbi:type II toxin-antitoxin system PemK/MazF family toxin [soil metagenome]|jgi:mRNA interferase MazF|nr:type II toxin-antitoxin system PemK/MazF family toxin [Deinococcota bacterium]
MHVNRFEVYRVNLEPAKGSEMNKLRPCVVVSPDELNRLATVIVAPLTSRGFEFPSRVPCTFQDKQGLILLDHLRAVDKMRLGDLLGSIEVESQREVCETLQEMFAY